MVQVHAQRCNTLHAPYISPAPEVCTLPASNAPDLNIDSKSAYMDGREAIKFHIACDCIGICSV